MKSTACSPTKKFITWVRLFAFLSVFLSLAGGHAGNQSPVEEILDSMSVDQKIGQMLMLGFNGTALSHPMEQLLSDMPPGGVILFRHNLYKGKKSALCLTGEVQSILTNHPPYIPGFVAVDLEGGIVKRLNKDILKFPSARSLGNKNDAVFVEELCAKAAGVLLSMGINMNLAPVLEPCGPFMITRSFGCTQDKVAKAGVHFIKGFQSGGVIATGKHFPGHRGVNQHNEPGRIQGNIAELDKKLFLPFRAAVKAGVGAIMTSHVYLSGVDSEAPASLSRKVIGGVLRNRLGFGGMIISDDLLCASKRGRVLARLCTVPESALRAVIAGTDVLILSDANYARAVHARLKEAVLSGEIPEEDIDASLRRILRLKRMFGIL